MNKGFMEILKDLFSVQDSKYISHKNGVILYIVKSIP